MEKKLHISKELALPRDAVTSTIVVYGGKGMGKTNLASVLVEEFAFNGLRFAVIDPMGVWWGLRHDADGRRAGIEAVIFGGIHGDLPIEPTSGADVADFVADEDASVIIDISRRPDGSMWSIVERVRFVTAYAKRLYQRQGEKRRPIMQVIDEAARFAPQIVRQGEGEVAACMGAIAVLVEEGRNVGIGVTLVTQRSARLNKDVAELADCMIAFRIVGPNSMRAVLDWLGEYVDKARIKEIGEQLRSLPRGSALVISPGWLEYEGIVAMRKRKTFDSSKTPEAGKDVRASGAGAKPDLGKYRQRFAKTIEDAKANDPKALKARVAELEKQLAAKPSAKVETKTVEKAVIKEAQLQRIGVLIEQGDALVNRIRDVAGAARQSLDATCDKAAVVGLKIEVAIGELRAAVRCTTEGSPQTGRSETAGRGRPVARPTAAAPSQVRGHAVVGGRPTPTTQGVTAGETAPIEVEGGKIEPRHIKMLAAIAWWETIGIDTPSATMVAYLSGSSPNSSGFEKTRGQLRAYGLLEYPTGGTVRLTDEGRRIAPRTSTPLTARDLHDAIRQKLDPRHVRLLDPLIDAYPNSLTDEQLAKASGNSVSSSGFEKTRGQLRSWGLAEYPSPRQVRASDLLFPDGAS